MSKYAVAAQPPHAPQAKDTTERQPQTLTHQSIKENKCS